jgi:hypothetical protein
MEKQKMFQTTNQWKYPWGPCCEALYPRHSAFLSSPEQLTTGGFLCLDQLDRITKLRIQYN